MKKNFPFLLLILFAITAFSSPAQEPPMEVYANRRQALLKQVRSGMIVIRTSDEPTRSNDLTYFPYKPSTDFYYLTGYRYPHAALILTRDQFILFVRPADAVSAQWYGHVPGIRGAMETYGADTAYAFSQFEKILKIYAEKNNKICYDFQNRQTRSIIDPVLITTENYNSKELFNIAPMIHEMRLIKDTSEIRLIRKAVDITSTAQLNAMKSMKPGMFEYEIRAIFSYEFEKAGASGHAFDPIVGSGPHSTVYHSADVNRMIGNGELVMMDAGAEYMEYAADLTREIPANGKFSDLQKEIHDIVVEMRAVLLERMKPGRNLSDCYRRSIDVARERLFELGLITDRKSEWQYVLYCLPFLGHPIGLDVHDMNNHNDNNLLLQPGMVFAVEPMIYVGDNLVEMFWIIAIQQYKVPREKVDEFLVNIGPAFEKYKGIAARIEDDVLITENGNELLSPQLPVTTEEIENVMAGKDENTNIQKH